MIFSSLLLFISFKSVSFKLFQVSCQHCYFHFFAVSAPSRTVILHLFYFTLANYDLLYEHYLHFDYFLEPIFSYCIYSYFYYFNHDKFYHGHRIAKIHTNSLKKLLPWMALYYYPRQNSKKYCTENQPLACHLKMIKWVVGRCSAVRQLVARVLKLRSTALKVDLKGAV